MPTQAELIDTTNQRLIPNYGPALLTAARGAGSRLWDADGKEYIDFFAGFGAGGVVGHCHPRVVAALKEQAETLLSHGNFFTNAPQLELAKLITDNSFDGKVFYCHSGGEANEAALKLVRLAGGEGRYKIISFNDCFHGRTMGALSLTPEAKQKGFEPMLAGNVKVDYGDIDGVAQAIDAETAGIFVEPIQGEGGVKLPTKQFMQDLRALCDANNLLLVCDEVWTAPARTGKWFAYQHYDIVPDVMTLAKAIGGGMPVGVCLASAKWGDVLGPGKHGCTMGGNPMCTIAGATAMKIIAEEGLVERAQVKGQAIMQAITDANIPCVKEVRGKGMMIGIQVDRPANEVFLEAMNQGLLICLAGADVLRLAPPLIVSDEDLTRGLDLFINVLKG